MIILTVHILILIEKVYLCQDTHEEVNWGYEATSSCLISQLKK